MCRLREMLFDIFFFFHETDDDNYFTVSRNNIAGVQFVRWGRGGCNSKSSLLVCDRVANFEKSRIYSVLTFSRFYNEHIPIIDRLPPPLVYGFNSDERKNPTFGIEFRKDKRCNSESVEFSFFCNSFNNRRHVLLEIHN